jgi:serine/threonine protein kinase
MAAPLTPGMVVNSRYKILRLLGTGSFGAVYLGMDLREKGSVWAIKEVLGGGPALTDKKELLDSFRNEAQILTTLSHTGIPRIVDFFVNGGRGYLVMERIEGLTLEEIAENNKKPLDEKEVITWALQVCNTLEYLHSQRPPIIFRDLKPSNVMLTIDERIVLIDFGIARFYDPGKLRDTIPLGTPGYSPPEQYGKGQTTPASDIYALATTMFFLLSLKDMAAFNFKFPPLRSCKQEASPLLEQVLARAMSLHMQQRHQSMAEFRDDLSRIQESLQKEKNFLKKYGRFLSDIKLDRLFHGKKR